MTKFYFCGQSKLINHFYFSKEFETYPTIRDKEKLKKDYQLDKLILIEKEVYEHGIRRAKANS